MPNGTGGILRHRDLASRCLSPPHQSLQSPILGSKLVLHLQFPYPLLVITYHRSLLVCFVALLAACASTSKDRDSKDDSDKPKNDPIAVGIIEFVNPDQKFVLIKMQSRQPMPIGQALTALDATGALTQLTISPERKGTHVTADIKSGNPRPGNLVIFQPDLAAPPPIPAPAINPSLPSATNPGAVEWRDGQPPPILSPDTQSLAPPPINSPSTTLPTIPLEPLPEEPPASSAP